MVLVDRRINARSHSRSVIWVEVRIWTRHLRTDAESPSRQCRPQSTDGIRTLVGEIEGLARVGRKIEQLDSIVLEPLDQFEVTGSDRATRCPALISIVRVVPVEIGPRPVRFVPVKDWYQ